MALESSMDASEEGNTTPFAASPVLVEAMKGSKFLSLTTWLLKESTNVAGMRSMV